MENSSIAHRLKVFRDSLGLTQAEFGEPCGLSQKTYGNLESGRTKKVPSQYLSQIESVYKDLSPTWLRHGIGNMLRQVKQAPPAFEEIQPSKVLPQMTATPNLEKMTPEQLVNFYRLRAERAERKLVEAQQKLAEYEQAYDQYQAVELASQPGGKSFTEASADAADTWVAPEMKVSHRNPELLARPEYQRFRPAPPVRYERNRVGFGVAHQ